MHFINLCCILIDCLNYFSSKHCIFPFNLKKCIPFAKTEFLRRIPKGREINTIIFCRRDLLDSWLFGVQLSKPSVSSISNHCICNSVWVGYMRKILGFFFKERSFWKVILKSIMMSFGWNSFSEEHISENSYEIRMWPWNFINRKLLCRNSGK